MHAGTDRSMERKQQQQPAALAACHGHEMPFLRGIDVNRAPAGEARRGSCSEDEEPAASSPNSTLSSLSGKRAAATRSGELEGDHTPRAGGVGVGSDDEDSGAGGGSRKKLRLSKDQAAVLEESFKEHNTLNPVRIITLESRLLTIFIRTLTPINLPLEASQKKSQKI
jgi:homeobox-leucine zipper protein